MTSNVVAWIRADEEARSNKARERETHRANLISEQHNREVLQHQRNVLQHERNVLAENARHNLATEREATRSHREQEFEARRSAYAQERLRSEENRIKAAGQRLSYQQSLLQSAATKYTADQRLLGTYSQVGAQRWMNQQSVALDTKRLAQNLLIEQAKIESSERMKSQEIAQRATQAQLQYQLGQERISSEYKKILLQTGAQMLTKVNVFDMAKKGYNAWQLLGY